MLHDWWTIHRSDITRQAVNMCLKRFILHLVDEEKRRLKNKFSRIYINLWNKDTAKMEFALISCWAELVDVVSVSVARLTLEMIRLFPQEYREVVMLHLTHVLGTLYDHSNRTIAILTKTINELKKK